MVRDFNLKEEIYKCSKCGQCKSVCPVYLAVKNEMFLARGRYILLNSVLNSSEKLSKDFIKKLDICLNCNVCKDFCPSGIDAYKVFTEIKNQYKYKYSLVPFSFMYKIYLNFMCILSKIYKYFPIKSLLIGTYADKIFDVKVNAVKNHNLDLKKGNVVYFEGCVNKYINPSDKNASISLINETGYWVVKVISDCCGYPYLNEGNFDKFKENAQNIINSVPDDIKYIVCSCDSCYDTLLKISDFIDDKKNIKSKLITLDKFLKTEKYPVTSNVNTLYFKPLLKTEECYLPDSIQTMNKKGICSTFENFFALKYKRIAKEIIKKQFYRKEETDNKIIITTCLLAKSGLLNCIKTTKSNAEVMSYAEYISKQK